MRSKPARAMLLAMGFPIAPSPTKPTLVATSASDGAHVGEARGLRPLLERPALGQRLELPLPELALDDHRLVDLAEPGRRPFDSGSLAHLGHVVLDPEHLV